MKNVSEMLHPSYEFLDDRVMFTWSDKCQKAFERAKNFFREEKGLAFFDPKRPLLLTTDVIPVRVGSV